jgi:hypothetical protein
MTIDKVRAKMVVNSIQDYGSTLNYSMGCVYSSDPDSENAKFSAASPSGNFQISISKEKASDEVHTFLQLLLNQEVYIDIIPVPGTPWRWCQDRLPPSPVPQETKVKQVVFKFGKDGDEIKATISTHPTNKYVPKITLEDGREVTEYKGWYWKYVD